MRLLRKIFEPKRHDDDSHNSCSFVRILKLKITLDGDTSQKAAPSIPKRIWGDNIIMDLKK
jgi:hypothetical protein